MKRTGNEEIRDRLSQAKTNVDDVLQEWEESWEEEILECRTIPSV